MNNKPMASARAVLLFLLLLGAVTAFAKEISSACFYYLPDGQPGNAPHRACWVDEYRICSAIIPLNQGVADFLRARKKGELVLLTGTYLSYPLMAYIYEVRAASADQCKKMGPFVE